MMKKTAGLLVSLCFMVSIFGCGEKLPFDYQYTSVNTVEIDYNGNTYVLNRFGPKTATPFNYQFESDGDVDIRIDGKVYDLDSPYDVDKPKKKKKKVKKSSTTKKKKN